MTSLSKLSSTPQPPDIEDQKEEREREVQDGCTDAGKYVPKKPQGIRAETLLALIGAVNIGGDAVEDCEALYDGDD